MVFMQVILGDRLLSLTATKDMLLHSKYELPAKVVTKIIVRVLVFLLIVMHQLAHNLTV